MFNKDILEGKWTQVTGAAKAKWGKLTDDDITAANGDIEKLAGKIQKSYGLSKEEVAKQFKEIEKSLAA